MSTMSADDFNRSVSAAKQAADAGPLVITERGEPAYVLLSIDDYRRLHGDGRDVAARLRMDDDIDIDFEPLPSSPLQQAEAPVTIAAEPTKRKFGEEWVRMAAEFEGADIALPGRSGPRPLDL